MRTFSVFHRAMDLPDTWDRACHSHPFLLRSFLHHLEKCNPCAQRYYYLEDSRGPSLFVTYQHRLNILTYGFGSLAVPLTIVGVPCSVASPGFIINNDTLPLFQKELTSISGGVLLLNSDPIELTPSCARSFTLPSCVLRTKGRSFSQYLESMRSHYRYKLIRSMNRFAGVQEINLSDNTSFSGQYYQLYEQVFNRSRYKLEKLPIEFFRNHDSEITLFEKDGQPLGFCQTKSYGRELYFLFGGINYDTNTEFDTYFNILLSIVKTGFDRKMHVIDLGQTAEQAKLRLGCVPVTKYLFARHSNPLINLGVKKCINLLGYRSSFPTPRVFKKEWTE